MYYKRDRGLPVSACGPPLYASTVPHPFLIVRTVAWACPANHPRRSAITRPRFRIIGLAATPETQEPLTLRDGGWRAQAVRLKADWTTIIRRFCRGKVFFSLFVSSFYPFMIWKQIGLYLSMFYFFYIQWQENWPKRKNRNADWQGASTMIRRLSAAIWPSESQNREWTSIIADGRKTD